MVEKWIVPCNIKFFDLISHFRNNKYVVWRNAFTIKKDDIVYIYVGAPYKEIKYKCIVVSDNVNEQLLREHSYAIPKVKSNNYYSKKEKYMELQLLCEYQEGLFSLEELKAHGLGQVQLQARTNRNVQKFLDKIESEINSGEGLADA